VKDTAALLCLFIGLVFCGLGCYVHYSTVADIPAAAMTLRLQWSGWEYGAAGLVFLFICWLLLESKSK
jgi:hypothetical protein